jgi:transposase
MKRTIKSVLRYTWRFSAPVRRPLIRKFDNHAMLLLRQIPQPQQPALPADLDLVLGSVVRELARLQAQIEHLQHQVADLPAIERDSSRTESRLSVVGETG